MWRPRYDPTRPCIGAGCLCDRSPDTAERNAIELVPAHLACRVLDGLQVLPIEVDGDEPYVRWKDGELACQRLAFGGLRIEMIDFEDGNAAHVRQAVRPRVEPGPEDDELLDGLYEGGRDRIID